MDSHYYGGVPTLSHTGGFYPTGQSIYQTDGLMTTSDGIIIPDGYNSRMHQLQTMSSETLNNYSDMEDHSGAAGTATVPPSASSSQPGARGKRRSIAGPDHVKHRRTRSGCYTCRQRRVKCDESHPTCERCRKGKRECVYPELTAPSSAKASRGPLRRGSTELHSPSSEGEHDSMDHERLPPIPDDEDSPETASSTTLVSSTTLPKVSRKFSNASSSVSPYQSPRVRSPARESPNESRRPTSRPGLARQQSRQKLKHGNPQSSKFSQLPSQVRFYINYHREHVTYHHYSMKTDPGDFLRTTFLEIALSYEPLLYAITAFSAYHHTLNKPDGHLEDFLGYYNKSVSLLRESLARTPKHSLATVLTILELATFEETLGDWVNLLIHQRAAYQIITEIFTPETIMRSETHRKIIAWYIRFDLFAGFMSGYETVLDREWHVACADFYTRQARDKPKDLGSLFEEKFAKSRLIAADIAFLFAKKQKGITSDEEFGQDMMTIMSTLETMKTGLENAFMDTRKFVSQFPNAPESNEDNIVDSTDPKFLWADELFTWNFILIDFWAIYLLFKSQIAQFSPLVDGEEVVALAFKICKMFEALQYCERDSTAMILGAQASLGMSAACLPKDDKTTMWCRRKYATIETCGYLYPNALRQRLTDMWGVDVMQWWLEDETTYPHILKSIREFLEYRALDPLDDVATSLKSMKGLFSALNIEDAETREGKSSSTTGTDSDQFEFLASSSSVIGDGPFEGFDSSPEMQTWT
ncbi:hypothetical protein AAFC00_004570 [Neodothiora populina]|uniref:Zn(2)-C6 fungal-type domain-containing protein n=1 Tax=Neodothiora populina TaxID=2781224 RepID=A0ABR3P2F8_9PEZI